MLINPITMNMKPNDSDMETKTMSVSSSTIKLNDSGNDILISSEINTKLLNILDKKYNESINLVYAFAIINPNSINIKNELKP
jgi:hypothetical protein